MQRALNIKQNDTVQGILGSGFALKVQQHQRQKHLIRRRVPAARYYVHDNTMFTLLFQLHSMSMATLLLRSEKHVDRNMACPPTTERRSKVSAWSTSKRQLS